MWHMLLGKLEMYSLICPYPQQCSDQVLVHGAWVVFALVSVSSNNLDHCIAQGVRTWHKICHLCTEARIQRVCGWPGYKLLKQDKMCMSVFLTCK